MSGHTFFRYLLGGGVAMLLMACLPVDEILPGQLALDRPVAERRVLEWPDQNLLFVADSRMGRIQAYRLGGAQPKFSAQSEVASRTWVLDLKLDTESGMLWVLGDDGVSVYDARSLVLHKHIPLARNTVNSLRITDRQVSLVARDGVPIGVVDCVSLLASWHAPIRRG